MTICQKVPDILYWIG